MAQRYLYCLLSTAGVVALAGACGSGDDGGDEGGGGSGAANVGGGGNIVLGSGGTDRNYEGGRVELTAQQADALVGEASVCAGWSVEPEGGPATLMMVVDTSLSMDSPAPNTGDGRSKWQVTREALLAAVDSLPGSAWVGIMFYPNEGVYNGSGGVDLTECVNVNGAVPPSALGGADSQQRQLISGSIQAVDPDGCTPTHGAYVWGLQDGLRAATGAPGRHQMLLITDGQPTLSIDCQTGPGGRTCTPANPTDKVVIQQEIAQALAQDGTLTWIIGSPGSEENETTGEDVRDWLSVAAELGNTATAGCDHDPSTPAPFCHFDMSVEPDFATGLANALASVTGQIVGCVYDIPTPPTGFSIDRDAVNMVVTTGGGQSYLIRRASDPNCSDGWYYDGDQVVLCSQTCSDVENDVGASLDLTFGCATNEIPEIA